MDEDTKKKILDIALKSPEGRRKIAEAMIHPLKSRVNYGSIGRQVFLMDDMNFKCQKCGFSDPDISYEHSEDECSVATVLLT